MIARIRFDCYNNHPMKYIFITFLSLIIIFKFFNHNEVFAISDPLTVANNKFGIHITDENDLDNAAKLVNSTGGDWGYVTIVIREDERNIDRWQMVFDRLRILHLIPLVRISSEIEGDYWKNPELSDVIPWADFLSKLRWVTKNRYVIIYNEPNHAKEWGWKLDPISYSQILSSFSATLKKSSPDFFILPAGFDASAPNSKETMDEVKYLKMMKQYNPDIFDAIDGWTSHSYPNPGFTGDSIDRGRGSVGTYRWELKFLKTLGVTNKFPVFITETGWPHQDGSIFNRFFKKTDTVPLLLERAIREVWSDENIVAITPFILNYQSYPFSNFSWQKYLSNDFYPQYEMYQKLSKIEGKPVLEEIPDEKVLSAETIRSDSNSNELESGKYNISFNPINMLQSKFQILLSILLRFAGQ